MFVPNNPLPELQPQSEEAQPPNIRTAARKLKASEKRCVDFILNHPSYKSDLVKAFASTAFAKPMKRTTLGPPRKQKVSIFRIHPKGIW